MCLRSLLILVVATCSPPPLSAVNLLFTTEMLLFQNWTPLCLPSAAPSFLHPCLQTAIELEIDKDIKRVMSSVIYIVCLFASSDALDKQEVEIS